jgi:hypothetical protein
MAWRTTTAAATRLARLQERLAEVRRVCAGDDGPVVAYADDDEAALQEYVAQRERRGADLVVVVWSVAPRPADEPVPTIPFLPPGSHPTEYSQVIAGQSEEEPRPSERPPQGE